MHQASERREQEQRETEHDVQFLDDVGLNDVV